MAAYQVLDASSMCHDLSFASTIPQQSEHQQPIYPLKTGLQKNKQKSQLCNKFMMFGLCPYGQLCKFAHGSHELRQNNKCQSFFNQSYCHYGSRCNFKHSSQKEKKQQDSKWKLIYKYNRECIISSKVNSRLLEMIKE